MLSQEQLCQVLWLCLWQVWNPPRSIKGQCHQGDACPTKQRRVTELSWNGNISLTIHPTTIFSHKNTQRTSEDQCRIQLECYISSCIWQAQIIGMWGHNTIQVDASKKGLGAALIYDDVQSPSHPKHSHLQSCTMQTMRGNYSPASSVQNVSRHMFLVDTSRLKVITNY